MKAPLNPPEFMKFHRLATFEIQGCVYIECIAGVHALALQWRRRSINNQGSDRVGGSIRPHNDCGRVCLNKGLRSHMPKKSNIIYDQRLRQKTRSDMGSDRAKFRLDCLSAKWPKLGPTFTHVEKLSLIHI